MELKLTNEEKEKVFAMYWGLSYLVCYNLEGTAVIDPITAKSIDDIEPDIENKRDLLLLTPLSAITDEHATEVGKMLCQYGNPVNAHDDYYIKSAKAQLSDLFLFEMEWQLYQYLISKGYDVPLWFGVDHWANGKTSIELGIAIYKTI